MEVNKRDKRGILKFFFVQRKNAAQTHKEINDVLGDGTISICTVEEWFRRFRADNLDTEDHCHEGRPPATNSDAILDKIVKDRHISVQTMSEELNIPPTTIKRHLKAAGYVKKLDIWVQLEQNLDPLGQQVKHIDCNEPAEKLAKRRKKK